MNNDLERMWPVIEAEIARARRNRRIAGGIALCPVIAAAAAWLVIAGPPDYEHDNAAAGQVSEPWNLAGIDPASNVSERYPLVCGNSVFALQSEGRDKRVACIDKRSGSIKWRSEAEFDQCRIACDGSRLYVLFRDRLSPWQCAGLDIRDGTELWRRVQDTSGRGSPSMLTIVPGGIAWTRGNRLILTDGTNGNTLWTRITGPGSRLSELRSYGSTVYAASFRTVYAFRAEDGEQLWARHVPVRYSPGLRPQLEIDDRHVYVTSVTSDGKRGISCMNTRTGALLWTAPGDAPFSLQAADGQVFVRSSVLSALNTQDGEPQWSAPVGGCGPISVDENRLYVVDAADREQILALDRRSGARIWQRKVAGSCTGVVADDDMAFISGKDSTLHAIALN